MVKAMVAVLAMSFGLQGCAGAIVYGESRNVTKDVLAPAVALEQPNLPQEAAVTCILKGMTVVEVLQLPNSARAKEMEQVRAFVREVAVREGVPECLAAAG